MSGRFAGDRVLLTGAQGFIGSWLAEALIDAGATVVVPRRDEPARSRFKLDGIEARCDLVQLDLLDQAGIARVINEHEVRTVFHLAAQTIVGIANRAPLGTFETNVRGTYNLLEACRTAPEGLARRIVVASSDKAYGSHDELPYREDFELRAVYPYDVSKACTDMIARSYAATFDLPVAVTRLANVYGGGDLNMSRVVPDTIAALLRGESPVIRSDGSPERDYLYAADAVEGYLAVAASLERDDLRGRAWNIGSGNRLSVLELVRRLIAVSGRDVEPEVRGAGVPAGEIDRQQLDSSAIRDELGWSPAWDLDDGLAEAFRWYERNLGEAQATAPGQPS